jgi:putative methyltransferase (TIGR04325 family)
MMPIPSPRVLFIELAPPILLRLARRAWHRTRGIGSHTFEGCYPSFSEAPSCDSYDSAASAQADLFTQLHGTRPVWVDRGALLAIVASKFHEELLTIIDFGGGHAVGLFNLLEFLPNLNLGRIRYNLVETRAVCDAVKKYVLPTLKDKYGSLSFINVTEDIPGSLSGTIIVNIGSSIQYVENYPYTLERLCLNSPQFVVASDIPICDQPTYVRQQTNRPHRSVPNWVFNRTEFISRMAAVGYKMNFCAEINWGLTHKHAPGPSIFLSMIFERMSGVGLVRT